jgi:hypothetical protein
LKKSCFAFSLLLFCGIAAAGSDTQECLVEDDAEYAVIAAALFPNEPEIPEGMTTELERDAYLAVHRIRLDGFHGSSYRIQDASMSSETTGETDPVLAADFNRKNSRSCRFIEKKLQDRLSPGEFVNLVGAEEAWEKHPLLPAVPGEEGIGYESIGGGEIVRLSRPGFDASKTHAVLDVDLQAGPEMGVGYHVFLEKSSKTGEWLLTGADRTRIY